MHTLKPKRLSKPIKIAAIAALAIIVVGGGVGAYYLTHKRNPAQLNSPASQQSSSSKINNEAPTITQKQTGDQQKQSIITNDQQSTAPSALAISYTATNQSGSTVYVRSLIANAITNNGSCSLTITSGSNTSIQTSGTQALADSSTCKGFNIPSNTLPSGTWHLHLVVTIDSKSGSADKDLVVN